MSDESEGPEYLSIRGGRVLLCEGSGDNAFFGHLLAKRSIDGYQIVPDPGGRSVFEKRLRAIKASRAYAEKKIDGIIIVSDNDEDPKGSFDEVKRHIERAGDFPVPEEPFVTISGANVPKIAVFMFPDRDQTGALETLILLALSEKFSEVREHLNKYVEYTPAKKWTVTKRSKMMLQCMIASICEEDPNSSLSYLWSKQRDFENLLDHSCFDKVVKFLNDF